MITTRGLTLLLTATAAGLFCSCGRPADRLLEQTITKTIAVEPGARISIRNLDGAIRLYGSTSPEMKVEAVKRAYGADRLEKISVNISAQGNSVVIETIYPPR